MLQQLIQRLHIQAITTSIPQVQLFFIQHGHSLQILSHVIHCLQARPHDITIDSTLFFPKLMTIHCSPTSPIHMPNSITTHTVHSLLTPCLTPIRVNLLLGHLATTRLIIIILPRSRGSLSHHITSRQALQQERLLTRDPPGPGRDAARALIKGGMTRHDHAPLLLHPDEVAAARVAHQDPLLGHRAELGAVLGRDHGVGATPNDAEHLHRRLPPGPGLIRGDGTIHLDGTGWRPVDEECGCADQLWPQPLG
jgi:hypothetical protein